MTTYEYDDSGLMIRSVTVREPEYSPWDVAVLIADRAEALRLRGKHGIPMDEATDPANKDAFKVGLPVTDFAQKSMNRAQDDYKKAWPDADMDSLVWIFER